MNEKFIRHENISMSRCDYSWRLGIPQAADMLMDAATDHAQLLGVGFDAMASQSYFWMAARCKYRFHRRPAAQEAVTLTTWPGRIRYAICNRYYTLCCKDELLIEGMTEWVIYNTAENRIETAAQEIFKALPYCEELVCTGKKLRMSRDFSTDREIGRHIVCSTDIDIGRHMNNVAYIRALMGMFTTEELAQMDIAELEINYMEQCREGETLSFRRRDTADGMDVGILHGDGTAAATVHLTLR